MSATTLAGRIEAVIGSRALSLLCTSFGGKRVYVPRRPRTDHPWAAIIGSDVFAQLCASFHGQIVRVPAHANAPGDKKIRVLELCADDLPCREVARLAGCSASYACSLMRMQRKKLSAVARDAALLDDDLIADEVLPQRRARSSGGATGQNVSIALTGLPSHAIEAAESLAVDLGAKILLRRREARVAACVLDVGAYPSGNVPTLAERDRWTNRETDPLSDLRRWVGLVDGADRVAIGRDVWDALASHPRVAAACGNGRFALRDRVAAAIGVDKLLVGSTWLSQSAPGETVAITRVWAGCCAVFRSGAFGHTRRLAARTARAEPNGVRVEEHLVEHVTNRAAAVVVLDVL